MLHLFKINNVICCTLIFATLAFPTAARAQTNSTDDTTTLIVINASPLSESQASYAGSASVIRPDDLLLGTQTRFEDTIAITPNFTYAGGTSSPRFFQIRGIGEVEQYEGAPNPSVGLIFDDLDLSGLGLPTTMFDLEQIEVLRGPQATRFGANGLAGVVNFKSVEPTLKTEVSSKVSLGSDELIGGGLAFGGSVLNSDELTFRISVAEDYSDGFHRDLFLGRDDTNKRERGDIRVQLRYQPSHATRVDFESIVARQRDGYDAFALNNAFTTQSDRPGLDHHDLDGYKLAVQQDLTDTMVLKSISSMSLSDLRYGFDGDWGNNPFWGINAPYDYRSASGRERDTFSQEFRVGSKDDATHNWLIGFFGQHLKETSRIEEFQDEHRFDDLSSEYRADSYAVFAALEEPIDEELSVGATLRSEHRETEYTDSNQAQFQPDFEMLGGSAHLKYALNNRTQLYTSVSRGFKGGGFNPGTRIPNDRKEYDEESLWNYEIGAKGAAKGGTIDYSLAAFLMQRYDQQIKLALQDDPNDPLSFTYLTDNAGRGRNIGAEFDARTHLSERLEVSVSAGLLNSEITSVDPLLSNLQNRDQSTSPPWSYALQARYNFNLSWYVRSTLSGQDSYYFDDSHNQKSRSYGLLGAEVGYQESNWKIALWGKNLTDEHYATRGFYFGIEPPNFESNVYIQRGDPASFGVTVSYFY